ncbi:MAG: hypothetical protein RQ899_02850 [Pseudomonadales bacterium]|nr:hypothetical protein [Pseudomonadales bacterium]
MNRKMLACAMLATLMFDVAWAQPAPKEAPGPAPRNAGGRVLLDATAADKNGLWVPVYGSGKPFFIVEDIPFKPWAKGLYAARQQHDLEPHTRCKASGAIRQFLTPYGVEILDLEALQRLYIFDIGGPHSFRTVYMDGRSHPVDLLPSNYGHNIGWWEGDTLVVDSVGYNEDFWFERAGLPHTEQAHVIEYFTRRDQRNLDYRFVLEDSAAYDGPVTGNMTLAWQEGDELFEYVCQQANYAFELMVKPDDLKAVGNSSPIAP